MFLIWILRTFPPVFTLEELQVSFLITAILDSQMMLLTKKYKCTYSRYADDLTFSTNQKYFPEQIACSSKVNEKITWESGNKLDKAYYTQWFSGKCKKD